MNLMEALIAGAKAAEAAGSMVIDSSLSVSGKAADAKVTGDKIQKVAQQLYEIREPGPNVCDITNFTGNKYAAGVYCTRIDEKTLKIWGTATGWVRMNILLGNNEYTSSTPTFTSNLAAGTYTLKADTDILNVYYGTAWENRTKWGNGATIILTQSVCVYLTIKNSSQSFGTSDSPSLFTIQIFEGEVEIIPTAVDRVLRGKVGTVNCDNVLTHADFDYDKKYNIFSGTTWTADKKITYSSGAVSNNTGTLVTDYIEIDPAQEYLCVNIYVYLMGETGSGLVTGGNRCWVHDSCAFYDADKNYCASESSNSDSSKKIPANAKYVRLTIASASMIPYAVLFYGQYTGQQWVRYFAYRKEILPKKVFASTGMENLKMVMFGDSITEGAPSLTCSYVDYANDYLRSNIINVGLGGTRMSQGSPEGIGLGSFASLCENIVSTEETAWDALEAYLAIDHSDWAAHVDTLKNMDWDSVQAIGLLYGANDWHNNVTVGSAYNEDPTKYDGACAYGLKKLLTKYPHLQVLIFTPFFRVSNDTNSDEENGAGLVMDDYGESLKNVQTVFHCPVVNSGNEIGINRYNVYEYCPTGDGTHPRKLLGLERVGRFVAESIKRFIQPY